jgi:DNA-directed RNA polymerase specialized sigma24 family protein
MSTKTITHTDDDVDRMLRDASIMTDEIRELQKKIRDRGVERRRVIIELRERNVTYKSIAEKMGVTEQNVYKILNRPSF